MKPGTGSERSVRYPAFRLVGIFDGFGF